jgi:hypothetical protein
MKEHLLRCMSLKVALSRHVRSRSRCPLFGVKADVAWSGRDVGFYPKRTSCHVNLFGMVKSALFRKNIGGRKFQYHDCKDEDLLQSPNVAKLLTGELQLLAALMALCRSGSLFSP